MPDTDTIPVTIKLRGENRRSMKLDVLSWAIMDTWVSLEMQDGTIRRYHLDCVEQFHHPRVEMEPPDETG